jgi:predicted AlkP superfamily pyrophosphatase or phosphodiesterase
MSYKRLVTTAATALVWLLAGCASPGGQAPGAAGGGASAPGAAGGAARPPALVVMVVVDQFREPYLERYGDLFTGGLHRLLDDGRFYVNATHDHAVTETAVGHATLSTGSYPMHHGIVANGWQERTPSGWADVENVRDTTVAIVGSPSLPGVSPHNLMRPGLADWIAAADPRSLVASVSGKDRGAVLPAAHARGPVYWFEPSAGRFVTSTYYRESYPAWADEFTRKVLPHYARDSVWESRIPAAALGRADRDTAEYEADRVHTFFPHRFADEGRPGRYWDWFSGTPMLDAATIDYAETMVRSLELGRDDAPDFLNVSLSQTDRIGHTYGPRSREQLDNLLSLDRELGEFLTFLDRTVGEGRWVVALSADHGSVLAPETLPQPGEPAGRRATDAERQQLSAILREARQGAAAGNAPDPAKLVEALERLPFVADAYTHAELLSGTPADSFAVLERRSLYPGRAAAEFSPFGVEVRYVEGWQSKETGTSHGTPYWYDRHVPMIFLGPGIPAGRDATRAATVDFAPTLARLLGIPAPSDLDGRVLTGVVGR